MRQNLTLEKQLVNLRNGKAVYIYGKANHDRFIKMLYNAKLSCVEVPKDQNGVNPYWLVKPL